MLFSEVGIGNRIDHAFGLVVSVSQIGDQVRFLLKRLITEIDRKFGESLTEMTRFTCRVEKA
jgi:hypothetical protein